MVEDQGSVRHVDGNRGIHRRLHAIVLLACMMSSVHAQSASPPNTPTNAAPTLAPVVVTGELPGPALWKVSKGDHVMWILGLVTPVPRDMRWKSAMVEQRIAASQDVLKPPGLEVGTHKDASATRELISTAASLKWNPEGETLQQVLAPTMYLRWRTQKERYMSADARVNYMRPIFAGRELYETALRHAGLVDELRIDKAVYDMARHHDVTIIDPAYPFTLNDPQAALAMLKQNDMDDQRCLGLVLDAIEHDLVQTTLRANAWATSDLDGLKNVLMQKQEDACFSAIDTSPFAKAIGLTRIQQHIDQSWIEHAEQMLARNTQTFALLPMDELFKPDGYLSRLQADGYTVQSPDP